MNGGIPFVTIYTRQIYIWIHPGRTKSRLFFLFLNIAEKYLSYDSISIMGPH